MFTDIAVKLISADLVVQVVN